MRLFELKTPDKGVYVAAGFTPETVAKLKNYQTDSKIPNPLDSSEFHVTIVYSKVPVDWETEEDINELATPKALEVWDTRDNNRCLVLQVDCKYLHDRYRLSRELGATYDFPEYKPHITLSYDVGDFDVGYLRLPDFELEIDHEYREDLSCGQ